MTAPILIVDDDADNGRLLERMLQLAGHAVEYADSGTAALAAVALNTPALVILDVMMPQMSGFDVLRAIRSDPRLANVPVVMHSARDDELTAAVARRDGAQGYFVKGRLGMEQLTALVAEVIAKPAEARLEWRQSVPPSVDPSRAAQQ